MEHPVNTEIERLRARIARLRGTMMFYADRTNYGRGYAPNSQSVVDRDFGHRARQAFIEDNDAERIR